MGHVAKNSTILSYNPRPKVLGIPHATFSAVFQGPVILIVSYFKFVIIDFLEVIAASAPVFFMHFAAVLSSVMQVQSGYTREPLEIVVEEDRISPS